MSTLEVFARAIFTKNVRSTLKEKKRPYKDKLRKIAKRAVVGDITIEQGLGLLGLQVQTDIQDKITDIKKPELKHRKGNPLVDTGHLRQSITFEVGK